MPRGRIASTAAWAQRTAGAGPSKEAKNPIPGRVDLAAAVAGEERANGRVVTLDEVAPSSVPQAADLLG